MGISSIGYYDEPYRAPPERGSVEDLRHSLDRTNRRSDILFNLVNRLGHSVERVTSDTTLTQSQYHVFANTDSADVTVTLPEGKAGLAYRIVNTGSSGNKVTISPDGTDNLLGANSSFELFDGESLIIVFDTTDGWY